MNGLGRAWMVAASACVLAACIDTNSPDFPGYDPYDDELEALKGPFRSTLHRWSVRDVDTGEEVASGCPYGAGGGTPKIEARHGQRLVYELWREAVFAKTGRDAVEFWCGDDRRIEREVAPIDFDLSCWMPADLGARNAARFIRIETNVSERPTDWPAELPEFEPARGLRVWLDIESAGDIAFASTGQCETSNFRGIVTIVCDSTVSCRTPLVCSQHGMCQSRDCSDTEPCPVGQVCLTGACRLEESP